MPAGELPGRRYPTRKFRKTRHMAQQSNIPLAERLRPRTLDDYIGQEHLVGPGGVFRKFIETGNVPSFILWGQDDPGPARRRSSRQEDVHAVGNKLGRQGRA